MKANTDLRHLATLMSAESGERAYERWCAYRAGRLTAAQVNLNWGTGRIWEHFVILLRDFEGVHIVWVDKAGVEHHHSAWDAHESAHFISRHVALWREAGAR